MFPPLQGVAHLDASLFALGGLQVGLLLPLRGSARLGLFLLTTECANLGPSLFLHALSRLELSMPTLGGAYFEILSLVLGPANVDSSFLSQGVARTGPPPLAVGPVHLGLPLLLRGVARSASVLLVMSCAALGSSLLLRSVAHIDELVLVLGAANSGLPFPLQGASCPGLVPSTVDTFQLGPSMLSQCLSWLGLLLSVLGVCRLASLLLALDSASLGLSLSSKAVHILTLWCQLLMRCMLDFSCFHVPCLGPVLLCSHVVQLPSNPFFCHKVLPESVLHFLCWVWLAQTRHRFCTEPVA